MITSKVIDLVVNNDLCVGCGLCTNACSSKALSMGWNKNGFLTPSLTGNCLNDGNCIKVCPFNPFPQKEVQSEDELANIFLPGNLNHHPKIGKYISLYAGFSKQFRKNSSSGGLATHIANNLLVNGLVSHVFSVKEAQNKTSHFEYTICSSSEELLQSSKTKYYPVTLSDMMSKIEELDGRIAIVGIGCFVKAIRLAQYYNPYLKEKISFIIGIICGGIKSKYFTEYLASKVGIDKQNIQGPLYRIKDLKSTANDYSFGCRNKESQKYKSIKMRTVGDMWGTGLFKANACDYCDDVTTELADISLGDAWLPPYQKDGRGTNVIVVRSHQAQTIINAEIKNDEISLEPLPLERFLSSQQGSFNHRHKGLSLRIKHASKKKKLIPPKRIVDERSTLPFQIVQIIRKRVRCKSIETWINFPNAQVFDSKMKKLLKQLKIMTRIYHFWETFTKN